ncbi:hypothetical protein QRX50_03560 [Amycolatopsis carbonis]|uniref:Uncharacterized protein n=1 Tax=Amycolatopsis carbonis TaxID=715471 RepID=A0A9Y2IIH5_9PSEU|nr:hypothetical protein [Amycolatopsis sp. 2-15]WIX79891.1 hypothetical protein QRX50_03560 [Amycolatopsis sp. 2-15]
MTSSEGPHDGDSSPARSGSDPDSPRPPAGHRRPSLAERKAAARERARVETRRERRASGRKPADGSGPAADLDAAGGVSSRANGNAPANGTPTAEPRIAQRGAGLDRGDTGESRGASGEHAPSNTSAGRARGAGHRGASSAHGGGGASGGGRDETEAASPAQSAAGSGGVTRTKPTGTNSGAATTDPGQTPTPHFDPDLEYADRTPSPQLKTAVALLVIGALALAAGAILPVSPDSNPGYLAWPLLAILALVPAGIGAAAAYSGRHGLAAGLTVGLAALAPGRLLLDLQFFANGSKTVRPELYLPDRLLDRSAVGAGFWLLVAGHVLTIAAGIAAGQVARQLNEVAGDDGGRRRWRLVVPLLTIAAGVGLLMAPVISDNPFFPAHSAFEGPGLALTGYVVIAGALLLAVVLGFGAASDGVARGTLGGAAAATFAVALPPLVGGLAVGGLHLAWGPVVAVVAMFLVLVLAPLATPQITQVERTDLAGEARVPSLTLWRTATALLALLTAVVGVVGALAPQLDTATATQSPARWLLLTAAILVALPAPFLFAYKSARGILAVIWAAVVLAGTAVLSTAITASQATGLTGLDGLGGTISYHLGAGAVFTTIALGLAGLTALAAAVTGVVERDDEGTEGPRPRVLLPVAVAAILSVLAFGTPVFAAPGYSAPGLWSDFDTPSWGLLTALLVVLGVLALSVRSRPGAAAAALTGAVLVLAVHVAQLPLVGIAGRTPALGFWFGLAAIVVTATAAATAAAGGEKTASVGGLTPPDRAR